ncbi:MAG: hypothetical protein OER97_10570 [Gammaproteobacteria bacterium]|nr:hypothetical protein [Gammaproteobacteria bacterium]
MKSLLVKASTLVLVLFASANAVADSNFGVGAKVGTLGAGLEGIWRPLPYFDLRAGGNLYDYDDDGAHSGINYDATLNLESYYATANFNFPLSPFRVTGGLYSNGNELNMTSATSASFDIGGQTFTPAEVGQLSSKTSFSSTAPYFGVGYDFSFLGKVGLNLDLGVLWQGEADVSLSADGTLANDQQFLAALEAERLELEDDVSDYKAWPVIALGFVYNF